MIGTIINASAVILGGVIGMIFHKSLPDRIIKIVFQVLGIVTLFLGFSMAIKTQNLLIVIFSTVLGAIVGELIHLDKYFERFGNYLKSKSKFGSDKFSEGFVTAFLLFCVGSMTILGAFEEGLGNKPNLLLTKSLMDGFSSIALASAFGIGVALSAIPLLIYQGTLTFLAVYLERVMTENMINELTAVGGLLLIGLGLTILDIKQIKVVNMLPALMIVLLMTYLFN